MIELTTSFNPEVQRICSRFHFGWVLKKDLPELGRDFILYQQVKDAFAQFGYELVNQPYSDWYGIRLRRELDAEHLDAFYDGRALTRKSIALIVIFYAKLVQPKLSNYVPADQPLFMTLDELVHNYGDRFRERGKSDIKKVLKRYLAPLLRYSFIIDSGSKYTAGANLSLLRRETLDTFVQTIITGVSDMFARKAEELQAAGDAGDAGEGGDNHDA